MALAIRTKRRLLRLLATTLLLGALGVATFPALTGARESTAAAESKPTTDLHPAEAVISKPSAVDPNHDAWRVKLQRPLYDPPALPPKKVVKPPPPPIRAKLLGTVIEPGASRAMIQVPGGGVEFRGVGEPLGEQDPGAVIIEIGPSSVLVERDGETIDLKTERGY